MAMESSTKEEEHEWKAVRSEQESRMNLILEHERPLINSLTQVKNRDDQSDTSLAKE